MQSLDGLKVVDVACGRSHTTIIVRDPSDWPLGGDLLFVCGDNTFGQIGLGPSRPAESASDSLSRSTAGQETQRTFAAEPTLVTTFAGRRVRAVSTSHSAPATGALVSDYVNPQPLAKRLVAIGISAENAQRLIAKLHCDGIHDWKGLVGAGGPHLKRVLGWIPESKAAAASAVDFSKVTVNSDIRRILAAIDCWYPEAQDTGDIWLTGRVVLESGACPTTHDLEARSTGQTRTGNQADI